MELDAQIFTLVELSQIIAIAVSHGLDFLDVLVIYAQHVADVKVFSEQIILDQNGYRRVNYEL